MFERFFPDETVSSTYDIAYEDLYAMGYRGLLFDIDNTLVEHGKPANQRALNLFKRLREIGFEFCLISNNKKQRVSMFNEKIGAHFVYNAHKPRRRGYREAMEIMGTNLKNTVFIGDQLFTDIWGAKRTGIRNILVKPIDKHEEIQIVLKRKLENIVLSEYKLKKKKEKALKAAERASEKAERVEFVAEQAAKAAKRATEKAGSKAEKKVMKADMNVQRAAMRAEAKSERASEKAERMEQKAAILKEKAEQKAAIKKEKANASAERAVHRAEGWAAFKTERAAISAEKASDKAKVAAMKAAEAEKVGKEKKSTSEKRKK
ncbi:YqeG family HAD IIIA-type phosphatase [Eubacterium xylanophilum]|uniref:YqeG family HAD IIIA-type phosphatase n=1 Tax=Eubacterium xylanophilum TaxID=39497 RepID=UPI0004B2A186